jgi:dihydropteroate synthase
MLSFERPRIMAIINATPDSFHADSRVGAVTEAVKAAERMISEGADILDVGGQSTRPGAKQVGSSIESARVVPVIEAIRSRWPDIPISIDTYHAEVAQKALDAGASLVNDISGATLDPGMPPLLADRQAPCILMHMQGTPETMQDLPAYGNVAKEVHGFLQERLDTLQRQGIRHIALDPGFGFGKTLEHNYRLLEALPSLTATGTPIVVGVSRKSMINKVLGCSSEEALNGTSILHAWALDRGAHILRVHDVAEAVECVKLHTVLKAARKGIEHD